MNNYIIPEVIKELCRKLLNSTSQNEKQNYMIQVEAIRDLCNASIMKANTTQIKKRA
jgi:hypothetical protein